MTKSTIATKLFILSALFWSISLNAQNDLESLKKTIYNTKVHDTVKLRCLVVLLGNVYEPKEFDTYNALLGKIALKGVSNKDNSIAVQNKYKKYLGDYYGNVGVRYEEDGNPKSLSYIDKSISVYEEIEAQNELYMAIVNKGLLLYQRRQYKKAIDSYFTALRYFEQHPKGNEDNIWYVYSNLGILYTEQGQHREAIKYYKQATHFIDIKKEKATVEDELQKSNLYINIGSSYIALKEYDQAEKNLKIGLALARKQQYNPYLSLSLGRLGLIDLKKHNYDEAEKKLTEAYKVSEEGFSKGLTLVNLGEVYYRKGNLVKAEVMLDQGLQTAKAINHAKLLTQAYNLLYLVNKANGNYKKSVAMLELFHQFNDSSKTVETKNEMEQQLMKYNYDKKELNLKLENQRKNNLLIGLLALLALLFIIGYFLYKNYRQKQAIAQFEKKSLNQKLLLSQMNPHFIFNSIDNIQSLIYTNQSEQAVNYLTKFSSLTRQILENSSENYISLAEELTMIDNYLIIQKLLHNNSFDFSIDIPADMDTEMILLPPMLTQPFIENAIKHGLRNKADKGFVSIRFYLQESKLFFEVADNGNGFTANEKPGKNKSLAMKITKERLENITNTKDFEFVIENITDSDNTIVGAKVLFEIPYIYDN